MNLARVIGGDIAGWDGLAPNSTVDLLLASLAPVSSVTCEHGDRDGRAFQVVIVHRSSTPQHVELWVADAEGSVAVIEVAEPPVQNLEQILMSWGPPEWVLEDVRFAGEAIVTERIYASRGITLSVAESGPDSARRTQTVLMMHLYEAKSVESYLAHVGVRGLLDSQKNSVVSALEKAFAGDLLGWRGLSGAETVETVSKAMGPITRGVAPIEKERMSHRFSVFAFDRGASPSPVELWVLVGQDSVSLVEYDDPPDVGLEQILAAAGPPELVLQNRRSAEGASVKEYVYASRGLTLSVAEPYSWSEHYSRYLTHVQLYRASSTDYYWRYIGPGAELHPFPASPAVGGSSAKDNFAVGH